MRWHAGLPISAVNCCLIFLEGNNDQMVSTSLCVTSCAVGNKRRSVLHKQRGRIQVVISLLVSVLLIGFKLSTLKEIVNLTLRHTELKGLLSVLRRSLEEEELTDWLDDEAHDKALYQDRIAAIEAASGRVYGPLESGMIECGLSMFAFFESCSVKAKTKRLATIPKWETKFDEASRLLLCRGETVIRASPLEAIAYTVSYDSRVTERTRDRANNIRFEVLQRVDDLHTIIFNRYRGVGMSEFARYKARGISCSTRGSLDSTRATGDSGDWRLPGRLTTPSVGAAAVSKLAGSGRPRGPGFKFTPATVELAATGTRHSAPAHARLLSARARRLRTSRRAWWGLGQATPADGEPPEVPHVARSRPNGRPEYLRPLISACQSEAAQPEPRAPAPFRGLCSGSWPGLSGPSGPGFPAGGSVGSAEIGIYSIPQSTPSGPTKQLLRSSHACLHSKSSAVGVRVCSGRGSLRQWSQ